MRTRPFGRDWTRWRRRRRALPVTIQLSVATESLTQAYEPDGGFYDEVFAATGTPRAHGAALAEALEALGPDALSAAGRRRDAIFMQQGITFDAGGPDADGPVRDRPFPLDLVPRIIPADEWTHDQARARAAHPRAEPLRRRRLPRARDRPRRHRAVGAGRLAAGVRPRRARHPAAGRRLLPRLRLRPRARRRRLVEGARGQRPHAERASPTCSRTGVAMTRLLPGLFAHYRVRPVDHYPALLLTALREVAPTGGEEEADRRRLDAGPVQLRLLRARVPRAPDGRRARRGVRPRRPRRASATSAPPTGSQRVHAIYRRHRRRLHRPARVPARLAARRARADARLPRRHASRSSTRSAPASPTTRRSTTTCRR